MSSDSSHAATAHDAEHDDDGRVHAHIATSKFYWGIFAALVLFTIVTVKVSYYDFGPANIYIAMIIATAKASLVATFFMHLRHDRIFNTLTFLGAFLFLAIFILLTAEDLGKRGQVDYSYGGTVAPRSGEAAPGGLVPTTATADETQGEAPKGETPKGEGAKEAPAGKKE